MCLQSGLITANFVCVEVYNTSGKSPFQMRVPMVKTIQTTHHNPISIQNTKISTVYLLLVSAFAIPCFIVIILLFIHTLNSYNPSIVWSIWTTSWPQNPTLRHTLKLARQRDVRRLLSLSKTCAISNRGIAALWERSENSLYCSLYTLKGCDCIHEKIKSRQSNNRFVMKSNKHFGLDQPTATGNGYGYKYYCYCTNR